MTETLDAAAPERLRPQQEPCPDCSCCTSALCERGRRDVAECMGHTAPELTVSVAGCPCSAPTTRGTHAWRAEQVRITRHATEYPMPDEAEEILRALTAAESFTDPAGFLRTLRSRGYVTGREPAWQITDAGRRYLTARIEQRHPAVVEVLAVDVEQRIATVAVGAFDCDVPVTVLLDQLTGATGLAPQELPNRFLEARANCHITDPDDLVLTRIMLAPPLPEGWMNGSTEL